MKEVTVVKYFLTGVNNPVLRIIGTYKKKLDVLLIGDGKEIDFQLKNNKELKTFELTAEIKGIKKLIFVDKKTEEEIVEIKNHKYKRMFSKIGSFFLDLFTDVIYENNDFIGINEVKITGINKPVLQVKGTILKEDYEFYLAKKDGKKIKAKMKETEDKNDFYIFHAINKKDKKFLLMVKVEDKEYYVATIKTKFTKRMFHNLKTVVLNLFTDILYEYNDFIGINEVKITGINKPVLQVKGTILKDNYEFFLTKKNGEKVSADMKKASKENDFYIFHAINKKDKKFLLTVKVEDKEYYVATIKTRFLKRMLQNIKTTFLDLFTETIYEYNDFIGINEVKITGVNKPVFQVRGTILKDNYEFFLIKNDGEEKIKINAHKNEDSFFIYQEINKNDKFLTLLVRVNGKEYFVLRKKNKLSKRINHKIKGMVTSNFYTVYHHNKIEFATIQLVGIMHPRVIISGCFYKDAKITFVCNHKEMKYSLMPTENKNEFYYFCDLEKDQKFIEIFLDGELILQIKNRTAIRIFNKIISIIKGIFKKIYHIFYVFYRGIRAAWLQYHFLIPPRLWKKYWMEFVNKMKSRENSRFYNPDNIEEYNKWLKANEVQEEVEKLKYNPLISILIPVYNINRQYLSACIDSILNQTYEKFEICLVDDASTKEETIETLKEYQKKDKRIKVKFRKKNGHISNASNDALQMASGEFVGLVDNDDLLTSNALYEVVKVLNENKKLDFIYSDEDKINSKEERCYPHFKPDFSPDTLISLNYICHFSVLRKSIVESVGGFEVGLEGAQDHDLFLKVSEKTDRIYHISKILYHWRMVEGSTAATLSNKDYAQDKGKLAIENALKRRKLNGTVEKDATGYYIVNYKLKKEPLISIIIPTRDYSDVLDKCLASLYQKTTYKNYEVIVVNNNSEEEKTFKLFDKYKKKYKNFKVVDANIEFNYSRINNLAVKEAKGEYIVLLNNDTEIITPEWLDIMVGYASLDHIGAVGAKLLYPDNTIQHGGVILGLGGVASHAYIGASRNATGLYGRLKVPYNYSAVTAACLMVKKEKFESVKGLEEDLKVAYNDMDFNIKLLEKGYYNIFLPQVELYHYESKSRGLDTTTEKYERFLKEEAFMYKKWKHILENDKMYNRNFSHRGWFVLDRKKGKE